jgi:hypothetical protein
MSPGVDASSTTGYDWVIEKLYEFGFPRISSEMRLRKASYLFGQNKKKDIELAKAELSKYHKNLEDFEYFRKKEQKTEEGRKQRKAEKAEVQNGKKEVVMVQKAEEGKLHEEVALYENGQSKQIPIPSNVLDLLRLDLFEFNSNLVPEVIDLYKQFGNHDGEVGIPHKPLGLSGFVQFDQALPRAQPAIVPPIINLSASLERLAEQHRIKSPGALPSYVKTPAILMPGSTYLQRDGSKGDCSKPGTILLPTPDLENFNLDAHFSELDPSWRPPREGRRPPKPRSPFAEKPSTPLLAKPKAHNVFRRQNSNSQR